MELRGTTGNDCVEFRFEGAISARAISKSVGQGGFNIREDVLTIQRLLNLIAPDNGGPPPVEPDGLGLKEDGIAGPKTIGAIKTFQIRNGTGTDARVDPGRQTLKRMNEVPKNALLLRNRARLLKVTQVFPELISIADKARLSVDQAIGFLRLGAAGLASGKKAFDVANLYFAFGNQPATQTLSELSFIRTTYLRAREVLNRRPDNLTGGSPFGVSIFTIDPLGLQLVAYSRRQTADNNREIPEVHSGLIFLADQSDIVPIDLFTHVLFHELIHFVDDEVAGSTIGDQGKYREKALQASHQIRMRNADNFALFGTHMHFGRSRLVASQPTLGPLIPTNL